MSPRAIAVAFTILLLVLSPVIGQVIDFETTPGGGLPTDDLVLAAPYNSGGVLVSFGFDSDSNGSIDAGAVFEAEGTYPGDSPGFVGNTAGIDTADPGYTSQLKEWFLRSPTPGSNFGRFVITYTSATPVTSASGEIWDIDGTGSDINPGFTEKYLVEAFDASNALIASIPSPTGTTPTNPLDARPWVFVFSGLPASIDHIDITFTGTKTSGIGLAFDNFYPTTVPEPGMMALAAALLPWLNSRRRRSA